MAANVQITQVLLKRGNTARSQNYTGVRSELTHDTGTAGNGPHTLRIHDGQTPGGTVLATQNWVAQNVGNVSGNYSNANVKSYLTRFDSNIIPSANSVYSLGSATNQWKDLWVSNATIYLNSVPLGLDTSGNLTFDGNPLVSYINGNLSVGDTNISVNNINTASVVNGNLIINFDDGTVLNAGNVVGPQGPQGNQGIQGAQGIQGIQGNTGPRGEQGIQGIQGNTGPQGPQGIQGIQGNVGPQGAQGIQGNVGPQGIQGNTGPTGAQGIQGNVGATGPQGIQGVKGDRGDQGISVTLVGNVALPGDLPGSGNAGEAYIVTSSGNLWFWNTSISSWADIGPIVGPRGDRGDTGEQGIQGNVGPQGDTGPTGPTGPQGEPGPQGDPGPQGIQGIQGNTGPRGEQGIQGIQGNVGPQGAQGERGIQGNTGPRGEQGIQGEAGVGVPAGGTTGQVLAKVDGDDYHTEWVNQTGGSGNVDLGKFKIVTDNGVAFLATTDDADGYGGYDINIVPSGEGSAYIQIPNNANAELGDSLTIGSLASNSSVQIRTDWSDPWIFGSDGKMTLPGIITVDSTYNILVAEFDGNTGNYGLIILKEDYPTANVEIQVGDTISKYNDPATSLVVTAAITDDGTFWFVPTGDEYIAGGTQTFNLARPKPEWQFNANSTVILPLGSTIGETANTTVISPPGAAAGQSLVIRPTAVGALSASGNIVPGQNLTITLTNQSGSVDYTGVTYEITGATAQQLGVGSLTGTFPAFSPSGEVPQTTTVVLPIPENSTATTFTLTVGGNNPWNTTSITVTDNGVLETSHIHLVAGDPVTTDIYLGDDDQYVKIERDGGDVVIGTNTNTNHWTFDTSGILTFPSGTTMGNTGIGDVIEATANSTISIVAQGSSAAVGVQWVNDYNNPTSVAGMIFNSPFDANNTGAVQLITGSLDPSDPTSIEHSWTFGANGSITFPDNTVQTTAYRKIAQDNLMLDGGGAAAIYEVTVDYAEGGFSSTRYGVNTPSFNGGGAELTEPIQYTLNGGGA